MRSPVTAIVAAGITVVLGLGFWLHGISEGDSRPVVRPAHAALAAEVKTDVLPVEHRCSDLLVRAQVQLAVVRGVWACLEPGVQALFNGTGDVAVSGSDPYFTGYEFIGCDGSMCVYALTFEATTAATTGISETTMTVWLDGNGLVSHAAIPKAVP